MAQNIAKIDSLFASYSNNNPGASVAIIKNGKTVFEKAYGLADLENNIKVKPETNFRLASVSKQFTAVAVLQLIEKGKLSLNTKLSDIFPELPTYAKSISVQQMLNHTSGILDYDDVIDEGNTFEQISDAGVLKLCATFDKTYFPAGTKYKYSNTAYVLLGLVIEKFSGLSYPNYLEKFIFKPLKMNSSIAYLKDVNSIKNRSFGYTKQNNNWIRKDQSSTSATLGDGGIYSNTIDLAKWDANLYTSKILPQQVWQQAFSYQKLNDGIEIDYGFGFHLKKTTNSKQVVYHTGSTTSFRNIMYRIPEEKLTIIILTNRSRPEETNMVQFAEKILDAYLK
jgi:CubicO group peptidase (beta-lactamase class C family)